MARKHNFLLGNGEKLTGVVPLVSGGGEKFPPYELPEATERFKKGVHEISTEVRGLPREACPGDEAVLAVVMHPRYVSKSDFPTRLFTALGLRSVGSRMVRVKPDKWGIKKPPTTEVPTEEIFVAGPRKRILQLETAVDSLSADSKTTEHLSHIERISFQRPKDKVKNPPGKRNEWLEVVLHNGSTVDVLAAFSKFAEKLGATVDTSKSHDIGGLTFVPVSANRSVSERMAQFSFLRVARSMPTLRPFRPTLLRSIHGDKAVLPEGDVVSSDIQTLIFDGGIPESALPSLRPWVKLIEPSDVGPAYSTLEEHGLAVTSAFLFGPIENELRQPLCRVDHVRVLDRTIFSSADP